MGEVHTSANGASELLPQDPTVLLINPDYGALCRLSGLLQSKQQEQVRPLPGSQRACVCPDYCSALVLLPLQWGGGSCIRLPNTC